MKLKISDNVMKTADFAITAQGIIPEVVVVRSVRVSFSAEDSNEKIKSVRYFCVNPVDFSSFSIRVDGKPPVVTEEVLEAETEPVYIEIPVRETVIKPYEIAYGNVKVSIVAPFVKLNKKG